MSKLPEIITDDNKTLLEVDKAVELQKKLEPQRHYLGMSIIGEECWRKLFYYFRGAAKREIKASGIYAIDDGYKSEDIIADRLRLLPFIELITKDPNSPDKQIGFEMLLGHFCGHVDGMIHGLLEAPQTWHVWENKAVNQDKFDKLNKLKKEKGEKNALQEWDMIYFCQAQMYMHNTSTSRHYLTVESPGSRQATSCRTNYNKKIAESSIEKARSIIFDNWTIPAKISNSREFYKCKWCEFQEICHDGVFPDVNCKTCRYLEPVKDGKFFCHRKNDIIIKDKLLLSCEEHIYNPALIDAELIEHESDSCIYNTKSGVRFSNTYVYGFPKVTEEPIEGIYTSKELKETIKNVNNLTASVISVQKTFDGEVVSNTPKQWDKQINNNTQATVKTKRAWE